MPEGVDPHVHPGAHEPDSKFALSSDGVYGSGGSGGRGDGSCIGLELGGGGGGGGGGKRGGDGEREAIGGGSGGGWAVDW